ncbi:MAG TPA: kelch repeat-containing protein, partial [Terracidiphilus sp.]
MLLVVLGVQAMAQTLAPSWQQQSPSTTPSARYIHAITYDAAHGQVVLFGGFGGGDLNDTWLWNGTNWTQATPANSPSARSAHAMVYDAARGQVVLFGGLVGAGTRLGDTWLWDGANWTQANPATSPSPRDGSVMVYDAAHGQVVLFGGTNGSDLNDTWVWNGINWAQANPAASPSARADYGMVYDTAHSQAVLFGGKDGTGNYLNDTWVWNGSTWIQQFPLNSPPARYAHGMAYDAAHSQTVMFGGYNGSFFNDTWLWDGTNWAQENSSASPSGRYAPNAITYDGAQGEVVLFGGLGSTQSNETWVWGLPGDFGSVNVCPSGQTIPSPCSNTLAFTYNLTTTTTFGKTQVVTQGTPGLDFTLAGGSTCTGTVAPGTCTVNITFAPVAPGLRMGAVQLFDNSGNQLASTPIHGVGHGPAIAFGPGTQTTVSSGSLTLFTPKGVTVDAAGNLYIADNGNQRVVKIAANGTQTTVGVGLNYPQGLAVDGAGNLFIADNNLNEVVEVPAGCTSSNCQRIVGSGLRSQLGVAVDGWGNVFIGDFLDHEVVEVPANGGPQTVVYSPGPGSNPVGLAVDAAGDLFIADFGLHQVAEIPAGCTSSSCRTTVGTGWVQPEAVAVDAAGDVFVADEAPKVVEVPAGCTSSACQITVSGILAYGVAVDGNGNVFIPDLSGSQMVEFNRSQPPSLSFAATNVGSTSSDSPQSLTIQNIGNQALNAVNAGLVVNGPSFVEVGGTGIPADCTSTFSLAPGAECNLSVSFGPVTAGDPLTSAAVFTDNALNAAAVTQTIALGGIGIQVQPTTIAVPNVVGQAQAAATTAITGASLALGTVSTAFSGTIPAGSVISQDPAAGAQVTAGTAVALVLSTGQPPAPNQLSLQNNYFVTGDYASAGVTLRGTGQNGVATGTITIPSGTQTGVAVPDGADILDAYLYWETVESTTSPSGGSGTFRGYSITGQQIGSDLPYTDGALSGTLRVYRADVNAYLSADANGIRYASGAHTVSLPDGGNGLPLAEGASLVVIYRVLSPNFPLKAVVIYDGSALPTTATGPIPQTVQGFYDAVGGAGGMGEVTNLFAAAGSWNDNYSSAPLGQRDRFNTTLNPGNAYAAVILSTPVNNSDNDGILDAWKAGPGQGDFHAGQPGYYDVKTGSWVGLPGATHGQKDLFVQLDYMCGAVLSDGTCDPTKENLFPSPDAQGRDPLAMVQQAFAAHGVHLHLQIGNAVPEDTCTDNPTATPPQLCQFPNQPGVIGWKNSLEISKLWPRNFASCATGGDCTTRFPYGQKDSYHYVLFGHSLAIPAWNSRFGTLTSIQVANGVTTIVTTDRGNGINACPGRITISGVLGSPSLNGIYNTTGCADTKTITVATPNVPDWSYPNARLPEPVIGLTSGTITSISGYSDLGGADSAVTLGLWETAPNQDMSKRANVQAGTMFHEIGHTLGLGHGGLYYDTTNNYVATFEANCKPNYQSSMNYLFQLDGVGPNQVVDFSSQALTTLNENSAGSTTQLIDLATGLPANFSSSAWYVPYTTGAMASPATRHCDGTPLKGDSFYRVDAPIAPITPAWSNGQDINFDGQLNARMRGYNDWANIDLRQIGATGGQFASLATVLSFGSSSVPLNIAAGGNVTLGSGGTVALGSGGTVALGSGGNVTLGSGGTITLGSGGTIALGSGGNVTLGSGGTVTPGSNGTVALGSGGAVTLN